MKRKVIQLAQNTFVVSLPSAWVKKFGLAKGDELDVHVSDDMIAFRTSAGVVVPRSLVVDVSGTSEEFVRSVVSVLHKSGYDEIEFVSDNPLLLDIVGQRVSQCIGFEVVDQGVGRMLVKNVAGDDAGDLNQLVRRTFLVTLQLAKGVEELYGGSGQDVNALFELEVANNRLSNYCHRLLNKQSRGPSTVFWYTLSWVLESIADEYRDLIKSHPGSNDDLARILGLVNAHVRELYEFVYGSDPSGIDELRARNADLRARCVAMGVPHEVLGVVKRVYDCFGSATGLKFLGTRA